MLEQFVLGLFLNLRSFLDQTQDEEGQTLAEYGMIISLVAVATILTATMLFKDAIVGGFGKATACLGGTC